ncbi:MAG: transcription elongation factor GreA [Clostridia bacterium]|nr:transcription elongation factor GreA [Clostridia bacterium]
MTETRILTFTDKKKLEEQLAALNEEKKRVSEEIATARGFGDLSENAEYDAAKAKEAEVYGNIARIEGELRTATFVEDSVADTKTAALGTVVRVLDMEYDEEDEYTLVGFTEADPAKLFISNESPIGMALIGNEEKKIPPARVGDIVEANTPGGIIRLKVLSIRRR